jgi:hypothetical protein
MTERELLIALFNAVGALTQRLTGDQLNVCVEDGEGNYLHIYADSSKVWFEPISGVAAGGPKVNHREHDPTPPAWQPGPDDSRLSPEPVPAPKASHRH